MRDTVDCETLNLQEKSCSLNPSRNRQSVRKNSFSDVKARRLPVK